jgi:zinc protease
MTFAHVQTLVDPQHFGAPPSGLVDKRLRCGARLLVLPTAGRKPTRTERRGPVSIQLWVLAGTSAEADDEHGCAHLLEHMLFKPIISKRGTPTDIATAVEALGGDVNAYTSHDETVVHATVPGSQVDEALEALVKPVVAPAFDATELARETQVVLEEIKQYDDEPHSRALQEMLAALYGEHSYARPVLGARREVLAHTQAVLARFHRRNYIASRMVLVVVGPVEQASIVRHAERLLSGLPKRGRSRHETRPAVPASARARVRTGDVHEGHIVLGWQAPALIGVDGCALEVAAVVLGHGEASWLSTQTRRRERLVTDAMASLYASRQGSTFVVSAHTPAAQTEAALAGVLEQVDRLARVPIDEEELRRASALLESDVVYRRETVQGMAHALGYQLSLAGDLRAERRYFEALASLTPDVVRRVCERTLGSEPGALSIIVPPNGRDGRHIARLRSAARSMLRRSRTAAPRGGTAARRARGGKKKARSGRRLPGSWTMDLDNGVRVRALVDRSVPMAAGWLVWPGGLRMERARDVGASPLIAALLTRGSSFRDGDTLAREIDGVAAVLEGFSARSSLGLHFECLAPHVMTVLRRGIECVLAPTFEEKEFEEERRVALEELHAEQDDAATVAFRAAFEELYRGHPFRWRRRGTKETLQGLCAARLGTLWEQNYPPGAMVLGLAGDVDPEGATALVEALLRGQGDHGPRPKPPGKGVRYPAQPRSAWIRRARQQAQIVLAYPGLTVADPHVPTLDVLLTIIGGQSGRLFAALRERQGLVYHVSASSAEGVDAGHVIFHGATSQAKLDRALEALDGQIEDIVDRPPKAAELERAKAWLIGQHETSMQRRSRIASQIAFDEAHGIGWDSFRHHPTRVAAVTAHDVLALAQRLFAPRRRVTAIVSARPRK